MRKDFLTNPIHYRCSLLGEKVPRLRARHCIKRFSSSVQQWTGENQPTRAGSGNSAPLGCVSRKGNKMQIVKKAILFTSTRVQGRRTDLDIRAVAGGIYKRLLGAIVKAEVNTVSLGGIMHFRGNVFDLFKCHSVSPKAGRC